MDDDDDDDNENIDDFDDVHDIPLLDGKWTLLWSLQNKSSLCFIVDDELEGYEWSFKHINHMDAKVCKIIHHIYAIVIKFICIPLLLYC